MAAAAPNAGMGLLNLGGCGVLLPSSHPNPSPGFLVSRRSMSVSPLGWGLVRGARVLEARAGCSGAGGALASAGEAGAGSSELRRIEKELTFSPTFTDYVKIMESVKLDRSSKSVQGGDSDGRSGRRRFTGDGHASVVRRVDRELGDPTDKSFERRRGAQRDRGSNSCRAVRLVKNDSQNNVTGLVESKMLDGVENSSDRQGKVEEYVHRRIVRGELSKIRDNVDNNDRKQSATYVKTRDNRGNMVVHQSAGNKHAQSNGWKDLQGRATSIVSRTSVPRDSSIIVKNTKSIVNKGKDNFTSARSNLHKHDFKYPRERNFYNSEVNTDGKFQRYPQRKESSGRNLVECRFTESDMDCNKPTVSRRYGNIQKVSLHYGHPSDSFQRGKSEAIRMQRGEHVQMGSLLGGMRKLESLMIELLSRLLRHSLISGTGHGFLKWKWKREFRN